MQNTRSTGTLSDVLNADVLRRLAGAQSYVRGTAYFQQRHVGPLSVREDAVSATVDGTYPYRVKLFAQSGSLRSNCTCPLGEDGEFCKHCVALGLAWLKRNRLLKPVPRSAKRDTVSKRDVRRFLASQPLEKLLDLLLEAAEADPHLRQRLTLQAAKTTKRGLDLQSFRQALEAAIEPGDYMDYGATFAYVDEVDRALDSVEDLLKEGFAAEAVELSEYAIELIEGSFEYVDDSDGALGGALDHAQDIHHKACIKAKPEPKSLAARLFHWELRTDWDTFSNAVEHYASILGKKGLAEYRRLAEAEWASVPARGPADGRRDSYRQYFRITHIMEALAKQTGDVDVLIGVMSRDLSSARSFLQIAQTCQQAGRHDAALDWAERGLQAFPGLHYAGLREFLAAEYHRRNRHTDAMALAWAAFAERPTLDEYRNLKKHAAHTRDWKIWRERAIAYLRDQIANEKRSRKSHYLQIDASELVRIMLWENKVEVAWTEAQAGGCSPQLWLELAEKRRANHPQDVLPIYQAHIEQLLARKNNNAYAEAVQGLRTIQEVMSQLDRTSDFAAYLRSLRAAHKPKRNFMALLDRARFKI